VMILQSTTSGAEMAWLWGTVLTGSFFTLVAYSRAGSVVFWRNIEGKIESSAPVTPLLTLSTGALIGMSVLMVALAGPISAYTDATAAQLLDNRGYIQILQTPMVEEGS